MKKLLLVCILSSFCVQPLFSQSWQMLKKIGIGNANDQAEVLYATTDTQGNTFVLGWYMGKITFGDVTFNGQLSSFTQYFLAKYDAQGNVQWAKSIAGSRSLISVHSVQVDNQGSVYLTGSMENTSDFFNGAVILGSGASLTLPSSWDPYNVSQFVCKYTASGEVALKKFYTGFGGNPLVVSKDGLITLKGKLLDSYTLAQGPDDLFYFDSLTCYTTTGQKLWQKKNTLATNDMKLYADDGSLWMVSDEDSQTIELGGDTYNVFNETLITEYNPFTGELLSVIPMDHRLYYLYPADMEIRNSHLYLYGAFWRATGITTFITFGDYTVTTTKPEDITYYGNEGYLAKYDIRAREFEWAKLLTSVGETGPMAISNTGGIYVNLGRDGINTPETVGKFTASGDVAWTVSSQAFIHDYAAIGLTNAEDVYVSGWVSNGGAATFGSLSFTYNNQVGFLAKIMNTASTLSGLSISSGTLSPAFQSAIMQYAARVEQTVSSITVTPVANDASAIIKVNGTTVASGAASQPINLTLGNNVVTVDVLTTDGAIRSYSLSVVRGNSAPVLATIGNKSSTEGTSLTFTATATDLQADQLLTYSLVDAPAGAGIDPTTGVFNWVPAETQGGNSYVFQVKVTDNGNPVMTDEEQITVTVAEVNKAPLLTSISNSDISCGNNVSFVILATDEDVPAQQLSFSFQGSVPAGATLNSATGQFSWTPSASQLGTKTFTVRVTDAGTPTLHHEQSFTLTVNPITQPVPNGTWADNLVFNTSESFAVNELTGATSYSWQVPEGFQIESGQNTHAIVIKALTGTASGLITVTAAGACGDDGVLTRAITASKAEAIVMISDISHEFSGEPKPVTVTTDPSGLSVEVLYEGFLQAPDAEGEYNVIVSVVDNNYSGFAHAMLSIWVVTAIEGEVDKWPTVAPNPTRDNATVDVGANHQVDFILTDLSGRTLMEGKSTGSFLLDLEKHASGMYILKCIKADGKVAIRRLVKY